MKHHTTCWELLEGAASGDRAEMERFAALYRPLIVEYLRGRWRGRLGEQDVEDAAQETLLECLRDRGAIRRAIEGAKGGFRPFLFGVTQHVARRFEERQARQQQVQGAELPPSSLAPGSDGSPERDFDRAWANNVVRQAREAFESRASTSAAGHPHADLLRLRFFEDLPIRDIAKRWNADAAQLHHEYAKARRGFREALLDVLRTEHQGGAMELERELEHLMAHLD